MDCWLKFLSKAGAERAIVNSAANLQSLVGAMARSAHLLRLVHSAVHQKVGCRLDDRGADLQACAMPLGVLDGQAL